MSTTKRDKPKGNKRNLKIKEEKWSMKYKKSINCSHPKGLNYQRQHCKYGRTHKKSKI